MSERLTDEELSGIEAVCNAATPGPWAWQKFHHYYLTGQYGMRPIILATVPTRKDDGLGYRDEALSNRDAERDLLVQLTPEHPDSVFIAAARTELPRLLAEVRALREELAGLFPDDPEWDNTDAAHPAFWRGQQNGVAGACEVMQKALAGDTSGTNNSEELQKCREDIAKLRGELVEAKRDVELVAFMEEREICGLESAEGHGYRLDDGPEDFREAALNWMDSTKFDEGKPVRIGKKQEAADGAE